MRRAMTQSDNTANDALLRAVGGPDAVRGYLARRYIKDIRFGPGERLLQSTTAGLEWRQDYSIGRNFYAARARLPMAVRQKALDNYLASPPDGAAPRSEEHTSELQSLMRISYAVFCLKKKKTEIEQIIHTTRQVKD